MKKSNLLLLLSFGIFLVFLAGIYMDLKARYTNNKIFTRAWIDIQEQDSLKAPAPKWLEVEGVRDILILPSDSFYLTYSKRDSFRITSGDTIRVYGYHSASTHHIMHFNNTPDPKAEPETIEPSGQLIIHGREFPLLTLIGSNLVELKGDIEPGTAAKGSIRLEMFVGRLKIGSDPGFGEPSIPAHFNELDIKGGSINMEAFRGVHVKDLHLNLDKYAEVDRMEAEVDRFGMDYSDSSKIKLPGYLLRVLQHPTVSVGR